MPMSHYPNGFKNGVSILGLPVVNMYGGNVYWVDSVNGVDSTANDGQKNRPFATLDYAIGRCKANNGDQIFIAPNHSETITGAGGITCDVAGVTITGFGRGGQRPAFLMDGATTVTCAVSAADVTIKNVVFSAGHADIVACVVVTATGCTLDEVEFDDNTAGENFLTPIKATGTTDNEADNLTVKNCVWRTQDTAALEFIELNADVTGLFVCDNVVLADLGTATPLILQATGKDMRGALVMRNELTNAMTSGNLFIDNDTTTANMGIAAYNHCKHLDVTTGHLLVPAGGVIGMFENKSTSVVTLQGLTLPAVDS